jgi:16S rRNA (cytidine1402-2'-O)-methyltransferase
MDGKVDIVVTGTLYIVATPIGNLDDFSPRAQRTLAQVDLIVAEDTRHSAILMRHFGIETPMLSMHEHNELSRIESLLERIRSGQSIAQISDAGTPLINDPGFRLVSAVREVGLPVTTIPGPSAPLVALTLSGLPVHRFSFEGFLPSKEGARTERLQSLAEETRTMIFFESPRRVLSALQTMERCFGGERRVAVARELTKMHESVYTAPLASLLVWIREDPNRLRGEFVLIVEGVCEAVVDGVEALRIVKLLAEELPPRKAAELASKITGVKKNKLYQSLLE